MNKENCALKLVDEIILYYDERSKIHQIINNSSTTRTVELQYLSCLNVVIKKHIILLHFQCKSGKR